MKKDLISLLLIIIIICLFGWEILVYQMSPFRGDIPLQFYPWKVYTQSMLAQREIPYWNPYTYGGSPFLANMQSAVFYPFDLMLYIFPIEWFYGLSLITHLIIAGVGTYWLARKCGASELCSLTGAVAYALNGFTMIHIPAGNHLTYAGAAWIPWMFLSTAGFVLSDTRKFHWLLGACGITFLHFLCGHPQMTFYSLFFSLVFALILHGWKSRREQNVAIGKTSFTVLMLGVFLFLGVTLAGVQFIPTLQYLSEANRASSLDLEMATEFSFAPHRVITLFLPEYYGTKGVDLQDNHFDFFYYWSNAYAGIIIPILALLLFRKGERPVAAVPLAVISLTALFFAWGRGNPFYAWLYQLPGFGHFRAPAKFLPYYIVSVCVLAALGMERLSGQVYDRQIKRAGIPGQWRWNAGLVVLVIIIAILGYSGISGTYEIIRKIDPFGLGFEQLDTQAASQIKVYSFYIGFILLLCAGAIYVFARNAGKPRLSLSTALLLLLCLDLFTYGRGYLTAPLEDVKIIERVTQDPPEVRILKMEHGYHLPQRIASLSDLYFPNYAFLWNLSNIAGYDPMSLRSYNQVIGKMEGWEEGSFHDDIRLKQVRHPVLDKLNVSYIFTRQDLTDGSVKKIASGKLFNIYQRNQTNVSWLYFSEQSNDTNWQPFKNYTINRYEPHLISFNISSKGNGFLKIAEWFYPGWVVTQINEDIDKRTGTDLNVQKSADGLRIIPIRGGKYTFVMEYHPPLMGWMVTCITMVILGFLIWLHYLYQTDKIYKIVQKIMGRTY
jgi:uncharacterized membrane protein